MSKKKTWDVIVVRDVKNLFEKEKVYSKVKVYVKSLEQ